MLAANGAADGAPWRAAKLSSLMQLTLTLLVLLVLVKLLLSVLHVSWGLQRLLLFALQGRQLLLHLPLLLLLQALLLLVVRPDLSLLLWQELGHDMLSCLHGCCSGSLHCVLQATAQRSVSWG